MRNLKKILALVLALVMSMSLLTVANAFSDDAEINEIYAEAATVLDGLKVFQGRPDGNFDPKANITRAEVATIIYRMATRDVDNKQVGIYAESSKLSDVNSASWYAGYVGFANNSQYIMGYPDGTFQPNKNVTGHEVLAMLLRVIGYGKNGEFQGKDWAINTAARAKALGITNNINEGMLSQPATREMVAEMAFRALLAENVTWSLGLDYQTTGKTLADAFNLEYVEGVVVANEYADLYDEVTMKDSQTRIATEDGDYVLNATTDLTVIGESRYAYVVGNECLYMADTGLNAVAETGDAMTVAKLAKDNGLRLVDTTERYNNFGGDGDYYSSEWKISYKITSINDEFSGKDKAAAMAAFKAYYGFDADNATDANNDKVWDVTFTGSKYVEIRPDKHILPTDMNCIKEIFYSADKASSTGTYVLGEVYVGSQSWDDISDDRDVSYREFVKKYIETSRDDEIVEANENGNWLKIVDNNGDGNADYVLKTAYILDQVAGYNKRTETFSFLNNATTRDYEHNFLNGYEPEVGDVVIYALIDGKAQIELAETKVATIKTVSYKKSTVTTTDGDEYGQSGIGNVTGFAEDIEDVDEKVEYNLYIDKYNYLRAYALVDGTSVYGLLTELYNEKTNNAAYVQNGTTIVELKAGEEKIDEFDVLNAKNNAFIGDTDWGTGKYSNWLQRAVAHLGLTTESEFDYDATAAGELFTKTNVAKYVMTEDGVKLYPVSKYAENRAGDRLYYTSAARDDKGTKVTNYPVYAVDYVQLAVEDLAKGERQYTVAGDYAYMGNTNGHINAVNDTEYYLVQGDKITYFVGSKNLPAIKAEYIDTIYAVAENTSLDANSKQDYWVANVVVIELDGWDVDYDSISLDFFTDRKTSDEVNYLDTLNNVVDGVEATVVPGNEDWNANITNGFYKLYATETEDATADEVAKITAEDIDRIVKGEYNDNGIFAGKITRCNTIDQKGLYIEVNDGVDTNREIDIENVPVYTIRKNGKVNVAEAMDANELENGDEIIWVMNGKKVAYIVDIDFTDGGRWTPAAFLQGLFNDIWDEQQPGAVSVEFFGVKDGDAKDQNTDSHEITVNYADAKAAKIGLKVTGATYDVYPSKVELPTTGSKTWKMTVAGDATEWTLTVNAPTGANALTYTAPGGATQAMNPADFNSVTIPNGDTKYDFENRFTHTGASIGFKYFDDKGAEIRGLTNGSNLTDGSVATVIAYVMSDNNNEAKYVIKTGTTTITTVAEATEYAEGLLDAGMPMTGIFGGLYDAGFRKVEDRVEAIAKAGADIDDIWTEVIAWNSSKGVAAGLKAAGYNAEDILDSYVKVWANQASGSQNDLSNATLSMDSRGNLKLELDSTNQSVSTFGLQDAAKGAGLDHTMIAFEWQDHTNPTGVGTWNNYNGATDWTTGPWAAIVAGVGAGYDFDLTITIGDPDAETISYTMWVTDNT